MAESKKIVLTAGGEFEFSGIGRFDPLPDITPHESARITAAFAALAVASSAGTLSYTFENIWDRINNAPELRRHFR